MNKNKRFRSLRCRRRSKLIVRGHGGVRTHKRKTGRTGSIQERRTPSRKRFEYHTIKPNPQFWSGFDI